MTELPRGTMEKPPESNDRGWRRGITIFTGHGKHSLYLCVWEWPDGRPCELFLNSTKTGTEVDKFLVELGKMCSRLLQAGVPVGILIEKLKNEQGPLAGDTDIPSIPNVLGVQDLIARVLEAKYVAK